MLTKEDTWNLYPIFSTQITPLFTNSEAFILEKFSEQQANIIRNFMERINSNQTDILHKFSFDIKLVLILQILNTKKGLQQLVRTPAPPLRPMSVMRSMKIFFGSSDEYVADARANYDKKGAKGNYLHIPTAVILCMLIEIFTKRMTSLTINEHHLWKNLCIMLLMTWPLL